MKKALSFLLAIVMLVCTFSAFSVSASATYPTYTVNFHENGDGTGTLKVFLPEGVEEGIGNGKVVISVSDNLTYVADSAQYDEMESNGMVGFNDANPKSILLNFATTKKLPDGMELLAIKYTIKAGATITAEDFRLDTWELGTGEVALSDNANGDVVKNVYNIVTYTFVATAGGKLLGEPTISVPDGTAIDDLVKPEVEADKNYRFDKWTYDAETRTFTAVFYLIGDANMDGKVNSLDAALILRHDAGLNILTGKMLAAADTDGNGKVNSLDAARILRFDAGLLKEF